MDYFVPELGKEIKLVRYNGDHGGEHKNHVINNFSFNEGFHIHTATEEAINAGIEEGNYAELTTRYSTFEQALGAFWKDVNILDDINKYFADYNQRQLSFLQE